MAKAAGNYLNSQLSKIEARQDGYHEAISLDTFNRHADKLVMANVAQVANVLQAMILTEGERMVLTPTYHVFKMYVPFQDAAALPVSYDGLPD